MNLSSQRVWCYLCESEVFLHNQINRYHQQRANSLDSNESRRIFHYNHEFYDKGAAGEAGNYSRGYDSSEYDDEDLEYHGQRNGLVGLKNIANTCYMNSALQALSNSPPLTGYFLECGSMIQNSVPRTKIGLAKSYHRLIMDMWLNKRRHNGYIVPDEIIRCISTVHPMFRGYQQHDTQEFLRCFMDQLHEELKEVTPPPPDVSVPDDELSNNISPCPSPSPSQSEAEYETCDSGVSEESSLSDEVSVTTKRTTKRSPSPLGGPTMGNSNQRHSTGSLPTIGSSIMSSNRAGSNASLTSQPSLQNLKDLSSNAQPKMTQRSIISDIFDGKLLSSVQCLTCDRVSTREETFQDLSLPIPGKDYMTAMHQSQNSPPMTSSSNIGNSATCTDVVYQVQDSWFWWFMQWFRSWFWGPAVTLHDCMGAFFSADELKGDNMYSCEKCNKLRNGVKFSRVLALPEMLCVHLKRFRHDLSYSSKISSAVIFPLTGLDMRQYLHKDCKSKVSTYDLCAIICHHGTVGSGHYICFAKHEPTDKWFEYDDQLVTQVSAETVQNCEAYVLFYRKNNSQMVNIRAHAQELLNSHPYQSSSDIKFFVSKQWLNRYNTFAEPGPIDNWSILCPHGNLLPNKSANVADILVPLPQVLWEFLYDKFGGGPVCNHPIECDTCKIAAETLQRRQKRELVLFSELRDEFQYQDNSSMLFAISMAWFRKWQSFARGETSEEAGPINNTTIAQQTDSLPIRNVRPGSDYAQINLKLWKFFYNIYGGGPEIILRGASEFAKAERELDLVDTAENLSLNDTEIPEIVQTVEQTKILKDSENELKYQERQTEKETTSILKPVKTVSFEIEDINDASSEAETTEVGISDDKAFKNQQNEKNAEIISVKKPRKPPIKSLEISVRDKRLHREQVSHFGAEGNFLNCMPNN